MLSVPYALHAETSGDNNWLKDGNNIYNANTGKVGIGTSAPAPSAALDITSTTGALLLPRLDSTQRDALLPVEGMVIYNTSVKKFQGYTYGVSYALPTVDQSQYVFDNACLTNDKSQSFTAGLSGLLTSVKVKMNTSGLGGSVKVKIRQGEGNTGAIIYQQDIYITYVGGGLFYEINPYNLTVIAGNVYTINVTNNCGGGPSCDFDWFINQGSSIAGGNFYCVGNSVTGWSAVFETVVRPEIPSNLHWVDLH